MLLLKTRKKHQPNGLKFQIKKLTNIFINLYKYILKKSEKKGKQENVYSSSSLLASNVRQYEWGQV